jgi:hypothetical protein
MEIIINQDYTFEVMFSKKEIKKLAFKAYEEFCKKHKVSCKFSLIDLNEFWKLAKKSELVREDLRQRIPLKIGALVAHGEIEVIYLNEDVLNQLTEDPNFVKAVVIHELYHIYLKNRVRENNFKEEVNSENRVEKYIEKEFPKYAKYFI